MLLFFLRTSREYLFLRFNFKDPLRKKGPWPCPYLVKYSPDVLRKKTKVLFISLIRTKKCFTKF